jgi:hypothetical protein
MEYNGMAWKGKDGMDGMERNRMEWNDMRWDRLE